MELTDGIKQVYIETVKGLKGSDRRLFMARVVKSLGPGGQRRAARELGWDRETIGKGMDELERGYMCLDGYAGRGRQRAEERLSHLVDGIKAIVGGQSQADPRLESQRL